MWKLWTPVNAGINEGCERYKPFISVYYGLANFFLKFIFIICVAIAPPWSTAIQGAHETLTTVNCSQRPEAKK